MASHVPTTHFRCTPSTCVGLGCGKENFSQKILSPCQKNLPPCRAEEKIGLNFLPPCLFFLPPDLNFLPPCLFFLPPDLKTLPPCLFFVPPYQNFLSPGQRKEKTSRFPDDSPISRQHLRPRGPCARPLLQETRPLSRKKGNHMGCPYRLWRVLVSVRGRSHAPPLRRYWHAPLMAPNV